MPNYKNGKIYKIVNDVDDCIYIGSTTLSLNMRMIYHRKKQKRITMQICTNTWLH